MLDFYRFKHLAKYDVLLHAVTTKSTKFPYSFSLALHTGEENEPIVKNRNILAQYLETHTPLHFVVAQQTHSANIKIITESHTKGWEEHASAIENCDALITNVPHVILSILTADCVPVLLFDPVKNVVAAVHAGWKGTQQHITEQTVQKMQEKFACNPKDIHAGIAPSIGKCCYEVSKDVAQHFFNIDNCFTQVGDKYMLDLPCINKIQLEKSGIATVNIEMSNICTSCNVEHFFSYRKEKGCSGRFMSMIGIKKG